MKIIGFVCNEGGLAAAELAAREGLRMGSGLSLVELPCTGRVDVVHLLKAFREGADAVFVAGCLEGNCLHQYGNMQARRRVEHAKALLTAAGLQGERLEMFNLSSNQGWRFAEIVREMASRAERLGPNPLGKVRT